MTFNSAIKTLQSKFEPAINKALDKIAEHIQKEAKQSNLYKGNVLRNSIIIQNGQLSRTVLADKDYAYYVEMGNNQKGEYIYPVKAKVLRFYINGEQVFAKRVRSHGPLPFMGKAIEATEPLIESIVADALKGLW